jgi:23S rRNA (guanosine2251-2'-O)-methyltransferase
MLKKNMDELQRMTTAAFRSAEKTPVVVVLENVRSMHNVGSVFRTADAFRIEKICLCGFTPRPPHRDINKTALGSTESVIWEGYASAMEAVEVLHQEGYKVFAIEQVHGSVMLDCIEVNKSEKIAVVFGNEAEGVSESLIACCDGYIEIPQFGSKHSFNISVAAGIVLWELYKKLR